MFRRISQIIQLPRRALSLLLHGAERLREIAVATRRISKTGVEAANVTSDVARRTSEIQHDMSRVSKEVRGISAELRQIQDRLLQYNLQLGRLGKRVADTGDTDHQLSARSVPLEIDRDATALEWTRVGTEPHPDPAEREWMAVPACPFCGNDARTLVNEFNKLILMDKAPDDHSARYDFSLCHACGISYATRRPFGERYKFLLANFGEVTAKHGGGREFTNPLLNPYPLTNHDREELKRRAAKGVFVSEHLGLRSKEYLEGLVRDRLENSVHVDLLGSLVPPYKARVLEIRPRTGMISESLRRLFGAEVHGMPIWESQRFLLQEVYGIESAGLVDYDRFTIPYDGQFDLIICNHMLTHAVRPREFFETVRRSLSPEGYIYFYNEPDDAEYLLGNQSMFATLNPLHMQAFDMSSFVRGLAANGFEVVFHRRRNLNHMSLARLTPTRLVPMTEEERECRRSLYQRARDRAILALRPELRGRFAEEWPRVLERGVAEGIVEFDAKGILRLVAR
jgi:SAM-dependent methyltransferase